MQANAENLTLHQTNVTQRINRIIFFSGGKGSFATADWVQKTYPEDNIVLYFTDTLWEHPDLYRFNEEASLPKVFEKLMEQEHHLKICVSAYRYIINDKVPEDERIPEHLQEEMLKELDDAYRDYFYDRAQRPKLYIHPAASANVQNNKIRQYSFMKRNGQPLPIREIHYEIENDMQIDLYDIGGCGCFVEGMAE
jgi:hypothetical protein